MPSADLRTGRRPTSKRSARAAKTPDKVLQYVLSSPWAISEPGLHRVLAIASRLTIAPQALEQRSGKRLDNTRLVTVRDGIATIAVRGPLVKRASWFDAVSGASDYEAIARDLRTSLDDREVESIVLMIDSPGGEVSGCSELARQIRDARSEKPIHAYVSGECCSAAYWLASACTEIHVADTALVGNLGVLMTMVDDSRRMKAEGLERITIVSSQTPAKPHDLRTEPGRERVQAICDTLADVFLGAVAAGRGVDVDTVLADYGSGGVFVGAEAVTQGLADGVTTYEALCASLTGAESGTTITPSREIDMPALKKGRAQAGRATPKAKATAKATAKPKAKPAPSRARAEDEEELDDEAPEDEQPTASEMEDDDEETPEASTDEADDEEDPEAAMDEETDEEYPAKGKRTKAAASLAGVRGEARKAERERILGILGYSERFGVKALLPFIEDPTCTREKAAAALLEMPSSRSTRLQALKGDDQAISQAPTRTAPAAAMGKTGTRLLSALARVSPNSLPPAMKASLTSSN